MNEENKNTIEQEEEKQPQVKQTTVRYFDDDLAFIAAESKELGIPQYEVMKSFRKSYERLKSSTQGSQQGKIKDVINYTDSIINLFKSLSDSCDELVKQEQDNALSAEQRYEKLVIKHNDFTGKAETRENELLSKIEKLEDQLKNFRNTEKSIDALEVAHSKEIAGLKEKIETYNEIEAENLVLKEEIKRLEDDAATRINTHQNELMQRERELHQEYSEKITALYKEQSERIEETRSKALKEAEIYTKANYDLILKNLNEKVETLKRDEQIATDELSRILIQNKDLIKENKKLEKSNANLMDENEELLKELSKQQQSKLEKEEDQQ